MKRKGLQSRPDQMACRRTAGQAEHGSAGIHIPVRGSESCKSGYHYNAFTVLHLPGLFLRSCRAFNHTQPFMKPLDCGSRYEHAAFEGII
ncbi:hypothetical protein D3C73_923740 [compost metagenome]